MVAAIAAAVVMEEESTVAEPGVLVMEVVAMDLATWVVGTSALEKAVARAVPVGKAMEEAVMGLDWMEVVA